MHVVRGYGLCDEFPTRGCAACWLRSGVTPATRDDYTKSKTSRTEETHASEHILCNQLLQA